MRHSANTQGCFQHSFGRLHIHGHGIDFGMKVFDVGVFYHGESSYLHKGTRRHTFRSLPPLILSSMDGSLSWLAPITPAKKEPDTDSGVTTKNGLPVPARSLAMPKAEDVRKKATSGDSQEGFVLEVPPELAMLREMAEQEGSTLGARDFVMLTSSTLLGTMDKDERILRTTFVQEYLFDFDPIGAATRCGYSDERVGLVPSDAELAARKLMSEPVVRRLIKEYALTQAQELNQAQVRFLVMREAANHGVTGSPAARQASQKLLVELTKKTGGEEDSAIKGGIMVVPARFANDGDWERRALDSQQRLKESVGA